MEVDPDFAKSGEAYLVGLAVTDTPASLGTDMLQFAAQAPSNPLAARKQSPGNLFTAAQETVIEFEEDAMTTQTNEASVLDQIKALFTKQDPKPTDTKPDAAQADTAAAILELGKAGRRLLQPDRRFRQGHYHHRTQGPHRQAHRLRNRLHRTQSFPRQAED